MPANVKSLVEGFYLLREWHTGQEVLRPPAVDGRFALVDGVVVTILKNWSEPANRLSATAWGSFTLDADGFSYRYEDATIALETAAEPRVSHQLPFEGTRSFKPSVEPGGLRYRRAEGGIEFFFTPDGLAYSENGEVLRVWKRVSGATPG